MNPYVAAAIGLAIVVAWAFGNDDDDSPPGAPCVNCPPIEDYARHEEPNSCAKAPMPGVLEFRRRWIERFGERPGSPQNIMRDCSIGKMSEHHEGRGWDWMIPGSLAEAEQALDSLFATDADGNAHAMLRRAGVMYLIFNRRMWRAYDHPAGTRRWTPYSGPSPHTDHIHFSFSREGGRGDTSFYQGQAIA